MSLIPAPPTAVRAAAGAHRAGTSEPHTAATRTQRAKRHNMAVLVAASVLGVWLGLAAPSVTPAAPPVPPPAASAVTSGRITADVVTAGGLTSLVPSGSSQ